MTQQNEHNDAGTSTQATKTETKIRDEDYGYDFYPERRGRVEKSTLSKIGEGRQASRAFKCITNVYACTNRS